MTTDIIKVVATLAISIVFDSCHNVRETVEEVTEGQVPRHPINIVNNSSDIIIADANDKKIDIGDVNAIGEGAYINKYSVLAHETYEAYNYQAKNIPLKNAHLNASGIERLMTGSYIDPLERDINANGISNIPIRNANNVIIHNIIIHTANGNIKKVSR